MFRYALKWISGFLLAVIVFPISGEFFSELARNRGLYDDPEQSINSFVAWLTGIANTWWYPVVLAGALGFGVGVWIDWLIRRFEDRPKARARQLAPKLLEFSERVQRSSLDRKEIFFLLSIAAPLELALEKLGIDIKAEREGQGHDAMISRVAAVYIRIASHLQDGDIKGARNIVNEMNNIIKKANERQQSGDVIK